jgi:hypothetical protein
LSNEQPEQTRTGTTTSKVKKYKVKRKKSRNWLRQKGLNNRCARDQENAEEEKREKKAEGL